MHFTAYGIIGNYKSQEALQTFHQVFYSESQFVASLMKFCYNAIRPKRLVVSKYTVL